MNEQYSVLSKYYDILNSGVDYREFAEYLHNMIEKHKAIDTSLVLDLACGTGKITRELADMGYDMTGIDISEDMLAVAQEQEAKDKKGILYLCQDMRNFELYGTVDAAVCCLDSINYLTKPADVKKCFSLLHNYIAPNGLLIFDINTPYRFENEYGDRDYVMEEDGVLLCWRNYYDSDKKVCDFVLTIFVEEEDGSWTRLDEEQRERVYTMRSIKKLLLDTGFEIIDVMSDFSGTKIGEKDTKWYFVCRCNKG